MPSIDERYGDVITNQESEALARIARLALANRPVARQGVEAAGGRRADGQQADAVFAGSPRTRWGHLRCHGNFDVRRGASNSHRCDRGIDLHVAGLRYVAGNKGERSLGQAEQARI